MKFSEMPYTRPDLDALRRAAETAVAALDSATSAQAQLEAYRAYETAAATAQTMCSLCEIRHTIDTRDPFYEAEQDYLDEVSPQMEELDQQVSRALLRSPFRAELSEALGKLLFTNLEIQVRSFDPVLLPLMQEENKLASAYQKLYASAMVEFDGKTMPLPKLGPYKESPDRAVRRAAYETEGRFFDAHQEELDDLFDKLVKNRTQQAKLLGHNNYLQLGYDRLGRNCYGPKDVEAFRDQIAQDMVPIVARVKADQAARLGLCGLKLYDDPMLFPDGNAKPFGTPDEILAAGRAMYEALSPETAEFGRFLFDNELLDVLSKDGKAPGGYCTDLPDYQAPFIFSNFNGTSGDVDVLTHEAGHAFASYRAFRKGYPRKLQSPTMESCECHSMSMEFFTQDYHASFFGPATAKYEVGHCEDALIFIPYGCMVDEFQTRVYENPDWTPAQRNAFWLELEKKYRPWLDLEGLPFYGRGAGWQRQLHVYLYPLYYIDYCMAQVVAFQFWMASLRDRADAWRRYLAFVDQAGTATFEGLVETAGLRLPYAPGAIKAIGQQILQWIDENPL